MFSKLTKNSSGGTVVVGYLTPDSVRGPYTASRGTQTIVHQLLQSPATRVTHMPTMSRMGTFTAVFAQQPAASAALEWFTGPYLYLFTKLGATAAQTLFAVTGGPLQIQQVDSGEWNVDIPYREVIE